MKKTNRPTISRVSEYQRPQETIWMGLEGFLNNVCASYKINSSGPKKLTETIFQKKAIAPARKYLACFQSQYDHCRHRVTS